MRRLLAAVLAFLGLMYNGLAEDSSVFDPLVLTISAEGGGAASNGLGQLRVTFTNVSGGRISLLRSFDGKVPLHFWFGLTVTDLAGNLVMVPSGGKVDMRGALEYVWLDPQESFGFCLDARKLKVSKAVPNLFPGQYKLKVVYSNQYGKESFKGTLESNTIELTVK